MVIHLSHLTGPLGVTEQSPYLLWQSFAIRPPPALTITPSTSQGSAVVSAFHVTHSQSFHTGSSGGGPSSSELPTDSLRKVVTPSSNSGSSFNSKSSAVTFPLPDSGLSRGGWQGARLSVNSTCWLPPFALCGSLHLAVFTLGASLLPLANSRGGTAQSLYLSLRGQQQWLAPSGGLPWWELGFSL